MKERLGPSEKQNNNPSGIRSLASRLDRSFLTCSNGSTKSPLRVGANVIGTAPGINRPLPPPGPPGRLHFAVGTFSYRN